MHAGDLDGGSQNSGPLTFKANHITLDGSNYDAGANHDPDGDSNGKRVTVAQP